MIPQRLELTNFLSYYSTTCLEFDGLNLACISGQNGAGKSSLLDAMTWALFGKSRSKSDDDVVNRRAGRDGQPAEVRFEFELESIHYRIIRQKAPGRTTSLELQMAVDAARWRTLSESGVRATQTAIEQLLRMNYDTFVNASFFLQGRADEFTTKTPGKRKEILAELLGVNRWDTYRDAARRCFQEAESQRAALDGQMLAIAEELAQEETRREELAAAEAQQSELAVRRETFEKLLAQMRRVEVAVQQQEQQVHHLHTSLVRGEARLVHLQQNRQKREIELAQYQALLAEAEAIGAAHAQWEQAREAWQSWQEKADTFNRLQRERRPHELALESARSRLLQRREELLARQAEVARMVAEEEPLQQTIAAVGAEMAGLGEKRAALAEQEEALHAARAALQQLEGERRLWQQEQKQLHVRRREIQILQEEQAEVEANRLAAEEELVRLEELGIRLARQRERHAIALGDVDRLKAEQPALREAMARLKQRQEQLEGETGGSCPVCGQELSDGHRHQVLDEVLAEGTQLGVRWRENKEQIAALEAEIPELARAIREGERLERDRRSQEQRLAAATARLEETGRRVTAWEEEEAPRLAVLTELLAETAVLEAQQQQVQALGGGLQERPELERAYNAGQKRLSDAEARLAAIRRAAERWETEEQAALAAVAAQLEAGHLEPEAQAELARLDEAMSAVGYDEAAHQGARRQRDDLAEAPRQFQALKEAEAAVRPLQESLAELVVEITGQEEQAAELRSQHEAAQEALAQLQADAGDVEAVEQELFDLREAEIAAHRRVGAVQQSLAVLATQRQRRQALQEQRNDLSRRISRLDLLVKSCGRDGVQALLIEQALPEIEESANALLERLSGGEMRITFNTQRELKSREELAETLDITISDHVGNRPYENFSGGEQFRVNFAIRLALSRILARRAGARLQTLIIDEGFGSQDPQGRQRLVEAINSIRDDFARILVITHVGELRDAFPRRIEVEKGPAGSQIVVF